MDQKKRTDCMSCELYDKGLEGAQNQKQLRLNLDWLVTSLGLDIKFL